MIHYIIGFILVYLGFMMPPYYGYEQIFVVIGGLIIFRKLRRLKNEEQK